MISSKERGFKFEINDIVWIKSKGVKGNVSGWKLTNKPEKTERSYTVRYFGPANIHHIGMMGSAVEYCPQLTIENFPEEELDGLEPAITSKDIKFNSEGRSQVLGIPRELMKTCAHSWQVYEGFTDRFDYCTKCDKKRK